MRPGFRIYRAQLLGHCRGCFSIGFGRVSEQRGAIHVEFGVALRGRIVMPVATSDEENTSTAPGSAQGREVQCKGETRVA